MHVEEYLTVARIARDLREACATRADEVGALIARARVERAETAVPFWRRLREAAEQVTMPPRWRMAGTAVAALGAVGVVLLMLPRLGSAPHTGAPAEAAALRYETRIGEQRTVRLADDSVLRLNTASSVTVRYTASERNLELAACEADFEVVHDSSRPFHVRAGAAGITDVGTRFDVRLTGSSTVVTVSEGRVAVEATGSATSHRADGTGVGASRVVFLDADQQIRVDGGVLPEEPSAVDARRATAWLQRQISFEDEPLERVVQEFNRYTPKPIEIVTPALRSVRISGSFSIDDTEAFIAFLRTLDGVRVEVTAERIRVTSTGKSGRGAS